MTPGARAGGGKGGHLPPPPGFEKMTSDAAVLQNTLKFSLAPSALALDTLYFSLKRREKTQKFSFAPSARRKMVDILYGAPKTCRLFKVSVILPPSGKISAGAHGLTLNKSFSISSQRCATDMMYAACRQHRRHQGGQRVAMFIPTM